MACWEMKWNGERERERCKGLGNWMSEREEGPKEGAERKGTVMQPNQLQPPVHTDNFLDLDLDLDLDCVLCVVVSSHFGRSLCAHSLFCSPLLSLSPLLSFLPCGIYPKRNCPWPIASCERRKYTSSCPCFAQRRWSTVEEQEATFSRKI